MNANSLINPKSGCTIIIVIGRKYFLKELSKCKKHHVLRHVFSVLHRVVLWFRKLQVEYAYLN